MTIAPYLTFDIKVVCRDPVTLDVRPVEFVPFRSKI